MKTLLLAVTLGFLFVATFSSIQAFAMDKIFSKSNWGDDFPPDGCDKRKALMNKYFEPDTNQAVLSAQQDPVFKSTVGIQNYSLDNGTVYAIKSSPKCNEDLPTFELRFILNNTETSHEILFVMFDPVTYQVLEIMPIVVDGRWQPPVEPKPISYPVKEWKELQMSGEFTGAKPPKPAQLFTIPYAVINGTLESITSNQEGSVEAVIKSESQGVFVLKIPRNYPYTDYNSTAAGPPPTSLDPIVLIKNRKTGEVAAYHTAKDCFYEVWVPFSGDTQIEVLFRISYLVQGWAFHGDDVPKYCLSQTLADFSDNILLSPLKQLKSGIKADNVTCKEELQLIIKGEDGSPACVKPDTATKLELRGWAVIPTAANEYKPPEISSYTNQTIQTTQIIPSCVSKIPHQYAIAGGPGIPLCPIMNFQASGKILHATGFYGIYNYTEYPGTSNFVLEPGHKGTITYLVSMDTVHNLGGLSEYSHEINITNDVVFMHDAEMHNHPGIELLVEPKSEMMQSNSSALVTITFLASKDALHGNYWITLPPGVCAGGEMIILTVTDCEK